MDRKKKSKTLQKIALLQYDLVHKSCEYGNVYIISCIRTIFFLKNDCYVRGSNGHTSHGYGWAVVRQHISQHMSQPGIESRHWQHLTSAIFLLTMLASWWHVPTRCWHFQLSKYIWNPFYDLRIVLCRIWWDQCSHKSIYIYF